MGEEKKRIYLIAAVKDIPKIHTLGALLNNPQLEVNFYDDTAREPVDSENADYAKRVIQVKIRKSELVVCFIGDETHKSKWVAWEVNAAREEGKKIIFMAFEGILRANIDNLSNDPDDSLLPWNPEKLKSMMLDS